jgi:hypothetical protein
MDELVRTIGDKVEVWPDKRKMLRRIGIRSLLLIPLTVLLPLSLRFLPPMPLIVVLELNFLPIFSLVMLGSMLVRILRMRLPILALTPEGLYVHSALHDLGLLGWHEIANVYAYDRIYRYVGIVPYDVAAIAKRVGRRARLMRFTNFAASASISANRAAPINIPQEYLPITADEMVQRIVTYRNALTPIAEAGTWPPPPGARQSV